MLITVRAQRVKTMFSSYSPQVAIMSFVLELRLIVVEFVMGTVRHVPKSRELSPKTGRRKVKCISSSSSKLFRVIKADNFFFMDQRLQIGIRVMASRRFTSVMKKLASGLKFEHHF